MFSGRDAHARRPRRAVARRSSLFALAGLPRLVRRSGPTRRSSRRRSRPARRGGAPPAPLRRDPAAARRARRRCSRAVASFAVMVGVMNLAGLRRRRPRPRARRRLHRHQRAHRRHVRPRARRRRPDRPDRPRPLDVDRPAADGGVERSASSGSTGFPACAVSLFGLGLGWNLAYVAATTQLVDLAAPAERGRLVGLSDLTLELHRRGPRARRRRRLLGGRIGAARGRRGRRSRPCPPSGSCCYHPPLGGRLVRRFSV